MELPRLDALAHNAAHLVNEFDGLLPRHGCTGRESECIRCPRDEVFPRAERPQNFRLRRHPRARAFLLNNSKSGVSLQRTRYSVRCSRARATVCVVARLVGRTKETAAVRRISTSRRHPAPTPTSQPLVERVKDSPIPRDTRRAHPCHCDAEWRRTAKRCALVLRKSPRAGSLPFSVRVERESTRVRARNNSEFCNGAPQRGRRIASVYGRVCGGSGRSASECYCAYFITCNAAARSREDEFGVPAWRDECGRGLHLQIIMHY